jgi:RNA polymerase sigma-70 factor, ECF subfamily
MDIAGNEFEKLFKEHYKPLCDLAFNVLGDKDLAKDTVQEVFLKLWKNRDHVVMGENIRNYLFKATAHTSLNHLRYTKRLVRIEDETALHNNLITGSSTQDLSYTELEDRVRQAIDDLPPKCKMVYLLSRHEGMKYSEIAETLEISTKTVENQMGIALEKLRTRLKPFISKEFLTLILLALMLAELFL